MSMSGHVLMDADIICQSCNSIVRPVQKELNTELTCPCCGAEVHSEIERFNQRYGWR